MGRPKGSKNKPKEYVDFSPTESVKVSNKPKKISLKEAHQHALSTLSDIEKGLAADRKTLEEAVLEEDEPSLDDALKDLGNETEAVKKHRGIKQKKMAEQIEWIFDELKNLRSYIQRIDEARLNLPKNESVIPNTDVVVKRKRRIKPSTNEETKEESK